MKKKIGRVGNSVGITFSKKECEIYNIELGDIVDLSDMTIDRNSKKLKGGKK